MLVLERDESQLADTGPSADRIADVVRYTCRPQEATPNFTGRAADVSSPNLFFYLEVQFSALAKFPALLNHLVQN